MRKKFLLGVGPVILAGGLALAGCSTVEGNDETPIETNSETEEVAAEEVVKPKVEPFEDMEGNLGEWITKSIEILDGELDDPRIDQSGNDEGFTYYLKSQAISNLQHEMRIWVEGKAIGEDLSNLSTLKAVLSHLQFVRTSHLGHNGEAVEAVELADQWEPTPDDMRVAYNYMEQLLHDLDIAVNHDGEGKTYGVTHTLNGDNVRDMASIWNGGRIPAEELEIGLFTHGDDGVSEYDTLKDFVNDLSENWAHDSKFRQNQMDYSAEMQLVEKSLYEIDYFEAEIDELGLTEPFTDLQQTAFEMVVNDYGEGDQELHKELAAKYDSTLKMIIEDSNGLFKDMDSGK